MGNSIRVSEKGILLGSINPEFKKIPVPDKTVKAIKGLQLIPINIAKVVGKVVRRLSVINLTATKVSDDS